MYTKLEKRGDRYFGLCPLHSEKTPSFMVSCDKQVFYCFGCLEGGSVVHFIMKKENLDFVQAMEFLADISGIDVSNFENQEVKFLHQKKQEIYKLNSEALVYFSKILLQDDINPGVTYLKKRNVNENMIKKFNLGFSGTSRTGLVSYLLNIGYKSEQIVESDLGFQKANGELNDKFIGRIMFPIMDIKSNIVGFGSRSITKNSNSAKYINTRETPVFKKGRNLFGLNFAKEKCCGGLIIVEGYMDLITLHQNNILNSAACLGTSFTEHHLNLIKKYTNEVFLCFDSDEAGETAAEKAAKILSNASINVNIIDIVGAKDVDEYINNFGIEKFRNVCKNSLEYFERKIKNLKDAYKTEKIDEKLKIVYKFIEFICQIDSYIKRDIYIEKFLKETEIEKDSLIKEIKKYEKKFYSKEKYSKIFVSNMTFENSKREDSLVNSAEKLLLSLMFEESNFKTISKKISPFEFSTDLYRKIAHTIYEFYSLQKNVNSVEFFGNFSQEYIPKIVEIIHRTLKLPNNLELKNKEELINKITEPIKIIKTNILKNKINVFLENGNVKDANKALQELSQINHEGEVD